MWLRPQPQPFPLPTALPHLLSQAPSVPDEVLEAHRLDLAFVLARTNSSPLHRREAVDLAHRFIMLVGKREAYQPKTLHMTYNPFCENKTLMLLG